MIAWSGRKKALMILAFIGPTLLGILLFNIYPITYNIFISFTNRNQYHPNPSCSDTLTSIIEPTCWPMFKESSGVSTPYGYQDPVVKNYTDLLGKLLSTTGLLALIQVAICFIPLLVAAQVNKHYDRQLTRPVSGIVVWIIGLLVTLLVAWLVNASGAIQALQTERDFFIVVFRTILFVIITTPINYIFGLALALVLNTEYIKGRTFFRTVKIGR